MTGVAGYASARLITAHSPAVMDGQVAADVDTWRCIEPDDLRAA